MNENSNQYKDEEGVSTIVAAARRIAHARFSHYYKSMEKEYKNELKEYQSKMPEQSKNIQ